MTLEVRRTLRLVILTATARPTSLRSSEIRFGFMGEGQGKFTNPSTFSAGGEPQSITLVDLNAMASLT